MAAQRRIIGENVVGYLGQFDIPDKEIAQLGYVEEIADGADDRLGTVDFPLDGIAGDVRRGDVGGGEQVAVDSRLVFPDIQDEPAEPRPGGQQGRFIHYFPAGSVDKRGTRFHRSEKGRVRKVAVLRPERNVHRHDIGLRQQVGKRRKVLRTFRRLARRIAQQHPHPDRTGPCSHFRSDVPCPDHAQRGAGTVEGQCTKCSGDILGHCS